MAQSITVGSKWIAFHARGRKDATHHTVRGITQRGVYVTSPDSRSPGHLYSETEFLKLFVSI